MGQNASVYDLRDPKNKLAHLVNSEHGNVYSVRFDIGQSTKPTTVTQEVLVLFFFILIKIKFFKITRQIKE